MPIVRRRKRVKRKQPLMKRRVANSKIGRPMKPATFRFKRTFEQVVDLAAIPSASGWIPSGNGIYKQFVYDLSLLPNSSDFTNLFSEYKLTGVAVKMYFSNNISGSAPSGSGHSNSQLLMRISPNPNGSSDTLTEQFFNESQSTKKRLCLNTLGKPVSIYQPLKQLNYAYNNSIGSNSYTAQKPRFITTQDQTVEHYGLNCRIDRVDGQALTTGSTNTQYVRIQHTVYLTTKQVS